MSLVKLVNSLSLSAGNVGAPVALGTPGPLVLVISSTQVTSPFAVDLYMLDAAGKLTGSKVRVTGSNGGVILTLVNETHFYLACATGVGSISVSAATPGYDLITAENIASRFQDVSLSTGTATVDLSLGKNILLRLLANCVVTLTNPQDGESYSIWVLQDASWTLDLNNDIRWDGGAPTITTGGPGVLDLVGLMYCSPLAVFSGVVVPDLDSA